MSKKEQRIGNEVIAVLSDRKGFDWWYDDLDSDIQREIQIAIGEAAIKAVGS